jgi:hypothetical protein
MKSPYELEMREHEKHITWMTKNGGFAKDMTMRDHYAGQALHGILTRKVFTTAERISEVAYEIADAMLVAREAK